MSSITYDEFLDSKIVTVEQAGFDVLPSQLHDDTYPHQADAIRWALNLGSALIAMSFGLGKTHIQVEMARLVHERTGGNFLIVAPLGVRHQFTEEDGPRLGVRFNYVRTNAEVEQSDSPYMITNYERIRDGDISPSLHFSGISLDEGSVLRSLGSKTYDIFNDACATIPYRYVCTATPSPNRYRELIYYAKFLGIMDIGQALTRWFKRDSSQAGNLTLHPHHEKSFWLWVASWALFVYKPSDLGYSDVGYDLPKLNVHWHKVGVDHSRAWGIVDNRGQRRLLLDAAGSLREAAFEKRATIHDRIEKMLEIINGNNGRNWLLWHHLEDERKAITKALPESVAVYGSQPLEVREKRILDFAHGKYKILSTKPEIAGSGCNFQYHCHSNIFLGVNYKFQDFIQAVHRTHRFQQTKPVDIHIIYAESEEQIVNVLRQKWQRHDELTAKMQEIVTGYGLSHEAMKRDLQRKIGVNRMEVKSARFTAINNDCVAEVKNIPSNSVGLIHTSIPFGNHYEYTAQYEDFGHNPTNDDFFIQMDYLIPDMLRILKPGRVAAIHVKDRILYGHQTGSGFMEVSPFSDETVMAFKKHGFMYEGRRTVVTDVVRENSSTYRLGWTEMTKDASKMGSGLPEYILLFRKPPTSNETARADEPVTKDKQLYTRGRWQVDAHSLWRSNGNTPLLPEEYAELLPRDASAMFSAEQLNAPYDHEKHVAICENVDEKGHLPSGFMMFPPIVTNGPEGAVWDDIVFMRTLNSNQSRGRNEVHICPLPLDIVERIIRLYSNKDDIVFDPFAGLFTVPYEAIRLGRIGYGIELNSEYFSFGVGYCHDMERQVEMPTLFDYAQTKVEAEAEKDA